MATTPYRWRQLSAEQRAELMHWRRAQSHPWHSPPHGVHGESGRFHLTAACYEHAPLIGRCPERMAAFAHGLLGAAEAQGSEVHAWSVLPNHYHLLVTSTDLPAMLRALGQVHGRASHAWNGEEQTRGRTVFCRAADRAMRSEAHFWATLNYIHHNPVRHGYVDHWLDWPWSSARDYLAAVGPAEAERAWRDYPLHGYGQGWDDPAL